MKTDYYVYAYLDPTKPGKYETENMTLLYEPLYVGKGRLERFGHGRAALLAGKYFLTNKMLYGKLCSLQRRGFDPVIVFLKYDLTADQALDLEGALIERFGRINKDPNGILCNRRKQGEIPDPSGKPKSKLASEKMKATRYANGSYYTGEKHAMARTYTLVSITGETFVITGGLKKFCESKNLSWQTLYSHIGKGQIKLDRSRYKNIKRLTDKFWNSIGWSICLKH